MSEVTVRTRVATDPAGAFALFTERVDAWWLRGPRFRRWPDSKLLFAERWLTERRGSEVHRVARVVAWEPGAALGLELDGDAVTVRFEADGVGTAVIVTQTRASGRTAFQDPIGVWWADLLSGLHREGTQSQASM